MSHPDVRPYFWMLSGSFSFTLMAVLAHDLLQVSRACDWHWVAVFRAALVALFAAILARVTGAKLVFWPWRLWVRSIAGSCSMICTFFSFARLPTADVITLTNTFPIWVAILAWPLYGHFPGSRIIVAILMGVIGVALVQQPHFTRGNLGVLTALSAAIFTAVAMLGLHSLGEIEPLPIVVHFSAVATVFCLVAFLVGPRQHDPSRVLEWNVLWKVVAMGLTALVGQVFLTLAFGSGAPSKVSVVGLSQIVFALAFDVWLFGYKVNKVTMIGIVFVIAPTAWLLTRSRSGPIRSGDNPAQDLPQLDAAARQPSSG